MTLTNNEILVNGKDIIRVLTDNISMIVSYEARVSPVNGQIGGAVLLVNYKCIGCPDAVMM